MNNKPVTLDSFDEFYSAKSNKNYRKYPSEELARFLARRYFYLDEQTRMATNILEFGCGTGSNLWMLSKEGFSAYGCDFSESAIEICRLTLQDFGVSANVSVQNMLQTNYKDCFFDCLLDIYATYCLIETDYLSLVKEIKRLLKPGGRYFSYTPSKNSDAFTNYAPAKLIDKSTLDGIYRPTAAFTGNHYPFRFMSADEIHCIFEAAGFEIDYLEATQATFNNLTERFEWLVFEAVLK